MTQLIRGLHNFSSVAENWQGCVATIGNFDGVHKGHQQLIDRLIAYKKRHHLPSVVILFEPQPREHFNRSLSPRLMRLTEKFDALQRCGVDFVLCLYFNDRLANYSADTFMHTILLDTLRVKHIVIGCDFKFGAKREGDSAFLQRHSQQAGFSLDVIPTLLIDNQRVSSTWLRHMLSVGDVHQVKALLGRPYTLMGRVAHGDKRGRCLGFPTANLALSNPPPLLGVYAVTVEDLTDATSWKGVANIGTRPTVDGKRYWLEVHIFDFDKTIYGHRLRVAFQFKLRDEKTFNSIEDLSAQIANDVKAARATSG